MSTRAIVRFLAAPLLVASLLGLSLTLRAAPDGGGAPPPAGVLTPSVAPKPQPSATVTISISVVPAVKATVAWGKQRLGIIKPRSVLVVQRPRDSGPLDLMIRADGHLPVQTRAYTFGDTKLAVRLTPHDQKVSLLGYREELLPDGAVAPSDGGTDGGVDAGVW
jgi:hypothetical protein